VLMLLKGNKQLGPKVDTLPITVCALVTLKKSIVGSGLMALLPLSTPLRSTRWDICRRANGNCGGASKLLGDRGTIG
jgi:hypothetical protein